MQHVVARSPAVLWVPPAAVQPPPALLHPPQVSPQASSPVQARAPRPSLACWVRVHPPNSSPLFSYQQGLIQNFLSFRSNIQVPSHPGSSDAPGHTHHKSAQPQSHYTRRVWWLLCQLPAYGGAALHLGGPDRRLWGKKPFCNFSNFESLSQLEFSCPVLSALSLAGCLTEPCPPSRTLLTWLISVGILLTHTAWLWVSVYEKCIGN